MTDKDLFLGTKEEQRENQMKKIKLEHSFFHAYRKTVKYILHKSEHIDIMVKAQKNLIFNYHIYIFTSYTYG